MFILIYGTEADAEALRKAIGKHEDYLAFEDTYNVSLLDWFAGMLSN